MISNKMNRLFSASLPAVIIVIMLSAGNVYALSGENLSSGTKNNSELLPQKKKAGIKKPVSAEKAKKQAEAKKQMRKKEGEKYIRENRQRSLEIQTPEVRERMQQNVKDANARYKAKKKNNASRTKQAGRKYR